jgi:hypothetical protein
LKHFSLGVAPQAGQSKSSEESLAISDFYRISARDDGQF